MLNDKIDFKDYDGEEDRQRDESQAKMPPILA
jgi:hypothetical protein